VRFHRLVLLIAVLAAAAAAGTAGATIRPVRPSDAALLKRAPTAEEKVAEQVASRLTRKEVKVRCGPLGVPGAGWPNGVSGITLFVGKSRPAGYAVLLPEVCAQLVAFRQDPAAWDPQSCDDSTCLTKVAEAAFAIATVTHESYHLLGYENEAQVECYGMQSIWYAATKLGAPVDEAERLAHLYADDLYPSRETDTPQYWSAQCRDGGKYDLRPNSHAWPS
jgi:hypothetical protein